MRSIRTAAAVAILTAPLLAQEPLADKGQLRSLESAAKSLARAGRGAEVGELLKVLTDLGMPQDGVDRLAKTLERSLARVKKPKDRVPAVAKRLRSTAEDLGALLAEREGQEQEELARLILRLDGDCKAARSALGYEGVDGSWLTPEEQRRRARRGEIEDALRRARRLPVELQAGPSDDPLLTAVLGRPGVRVRAAGLDIHSSWSEAQVRRVVTEALRALAVSRWLVTGRLEIPTGLHPDRWILLHSKVDYDNAVDYAAGIGALQDTVAEAKELSGFFGYKDFNVDWNRTEADTEASLISRLADTLSLPCLSAGHKNWICLTFFGSSLPGYMWYESTESGAPARGTTASSAETIERREYRQLAEAGLLGSRSWMAYLVERGEDPPWSRSFLDELGKIVEDNLCKSTIVMDFLYEHGPLPEPFRGSPPAELDTTTQIEHIERGLGESLTAFEERWRSWLRSTRPSLAERLDEPETASLSNDERELLEYLMTLRRPALRTAGVAEVLDVKFDPTLSAGARLHAAYLVLHPEQLASWPEAHEEFPDKEGFTAKGSWAGGNSVIAPGVSSPREAVDAWMATFYHRLPLLETGLLRVGWGFENGVAVLDAGSLCRQREYMSAVLWPYDGMKDVPTRFEPELPNPVPGEDQSSWGYPVTLQLGDRLRDEAGTRPVEVRMSLHAGTSADAPAVPCHFSTPGEPTNPELAPAATWCLIPKQPLRKGSTYTVVVEIVSEGQTNTYRFKT